MGDQKKNSFIEDVRLEFFLNYLIKSMKMKQEKWNKMINTEEFAVSLLKFYLFKLFSVSIFKSSMRNMKHFLFYTSNTYVCTYASNFYLENGSIDFDEIWESTVFGCKNQI